MEVNEQATTQLPPATPTASKFKVGDLVHVFQGTAAYVRGRNTVAFIGRVVGYNERDAKWEVQPKLLTYPHHAPNLAFHK
jgi:hypothetical protein